MVTLVTYLLFLGKMCYVK